MRAGDAQSHDACALARPACCSADTVARVLRRYRANRANRPCRWIPQRIALPLHEAIANRLARALEPEWLRVVVTQQPGDVVWARIAEEAQIPGDEFGGIGRRRDQL